MSQKLALQKKQSFDLSLLFGNRLIPGGPLPDNISPDQLTANYYLSNNVFPNLLQAVEILLEKIEQNGELDKFMNVVSARHEKEKKEQKQKEKDKRRQQLGDAYVSSDSDIMEESEEDEQDSEDNDDDEEDLENSQTLTNEYENTEELIDQESYVSSVYETQSRQRKSRKSAGHVLVVDEQFNALRFLANTLKELCRAQRRQNSSVNQLKC
ncbi:UNKNOWN [Stylonychia lemnae]|uniref:Uncharacterized protein n=1 Tax=Stylonychia lemnae TaxID=5949 RepID=A0A077ZTU5_STYLE|nr:UNKNOWN [Stylonychia lemnae]|eukprot:CDW72989.1 UNKNOWN [Stylonychia lemnae]